MLGHMHRECDLAEGMDEIEELLEDELPFGEWMRASPMKKESVTIEENRKPIKSTLRRKLFDSFKKKMKLSRDMENEQTSEQWNETKHDDTELEEISAHMEKVSVNAGLPGETVSYDMNEQGTAKTPLLSKNLINTTASITQPTLNCWVMEIDCFTYPLTSGIFLGPFKTVYESVGLLGLWPSFGYLYPSDSL
ncbi:hypothetical protein ACS0TY_023981 [Phlomoides rotata]